MKQAKARENRLELTFTETVEPEKLDPSSFAASAWNYRWSKGYGSPTFMLSEPDTRGTEELTIQDLSLSQDGKTLLVAIPGLQPCHNLKLDFAVTGANGSGLKGPVYFTIHKLPQS